MSQQSQNTESLRERVERCIRERDKDAQEKLRRQARNEFNKLFTGTQAQSPTNRKI